MFGCSRAVIETEQPKLLKYDNADNAADNAGKGTYNHNQTKPIELIQDTDSFKRPFEYFGTSPTYPLHKLSQPQYPDFSKDIHGKTGLKRAVQNSINYYSKISPSKSFYFGNDKYSASFMRLSAKTFLDFLNKSPSSKEINDFIHKYYTVYTTIREYRSDDYKNNSSEFDLSVLFTGYYEPYLKGSLIKEGGYIYPIYSKPDDLIEVPKGGFSGKYKGTPAKGARRNAKNEIVPYYTRAEIDASKNFIKHAKPLAWVNCRIDRFFLEIQGSGVVELKQGGTLKVQYHSKNGQPYRSIGKYLVDKGEMKKEKVSMQSLRKWLDENPSRVDEVLNHNPSFVFFKEGKGEPIGCLGVPVTKMRTIASDVSIFPKGSLCFMETTIPTWNSSENNIAWQNHSVFVLNQDTGGAIKGSGRADYFCGSGNYAALCAGYMKQMGRLYFLVLKQ